MAAEEDKGPAMTSEELYKYVRAEVETFFKARLAQSHTRHKISKEPYIVLAANVGTSVFFDQLAKAIAESLERAD